MEPLPVIACLSIATAGAIVFKGSKSAETPLSRPSPPVSTRVKSRERPDQSASSPARSIKSACHLNHAGRQDRVRALSDSDLQSLTRATIAGYLSAADNPSRRAAVPLLTLLAMESGRRDIDGFFVEINELSYLESSFIGDFRFCLHSAAVAGLAAENPQRAVALQIPGDDLCFPSATTIFATKEAIIRAWARMDPDTAWQAVSAGLEEGESLPIQGLLAETKDPALRASILDWVSKAIAVRQPGDEPVTRNSIDAILNNPNRGNVDALKFSVALGLAEQDPDAAWLWIKGPPLKDKVPTIGDFPAISRLFNSPSDRFLREWSVRQPEQALAFLNQHTDSLTIGEKTELASGLFNRDPLSALDALPTFTDPNERLGWLSTWIQRLPSTSNENTWPVLPYLNETLSRAQVLATVSENIDRLHLPSELETIALEAVRSAQEALGNP